MLSQIVTLIFELIVLSLLNWIPYRRWRSIDGTLKAVRRDLRRSRRSCLRGRRAHEQRLDVHDRRLDRIDGGDIALAAGEVC